MGITKTEIFSARQNKLANMLKALAHPARIAIIQHLVKAQHCICGDLVEELGLAVTEGRIFTLRQGVVRVILQAPGQFAGTFTFYSYQQ